MFSSYLDVIMLHLTAKFKQLSDAQQTPLDSYITLQSGAVKTNEKPIQDEITAGRTLRSKDKQQRGCGVICSSSRAHLRQTQEVQETRNILRQKNLFSQQIQKN